MSVSMNNTYLPSNSHEHIYNEFNRIIFNKSINTVFQPIVELQAGSVFGYEALTRGPQESHFHSPINLFTYAEHTGSLYKLERIARESALHKSKTLMSPNNKLFININSKVIHDPNFTPGHTMSLLDQYNLAPSNIVFEITERSAIQDFLAFKEVLKHYRDQGFKIAVDDAGAGYSSLQAISELMPDYIKVDRSLVSGIHENEVKKHILEAFVTFAKKMNSSVIAEGIETSCELERVIELGIDYGQGYYLARPHGFPLNPLSHSIIQEISYFNHSRLKRDPIVVQLNDEIIVLDGGQIIKKSLVRDLI